MPSERKGATKDKVINLAHGMHLEMLRRDMTNGEILEALCLEILMLTEGLLEMEQYADYDEDDPGDLIAVLRGACKRVIAERDEYNHGDGEFLCPSCDRAQQVPYNVLATARCRYCGSLMGEEPEAN